MRITKKMLREAKSGFGLRCKELCLMSPDELEAEVKQCFPYATYTGSHGELLCYMIQDLMDLAIPPHWYE